MNRTNSLCCLALVLALALGGCGRKGPLYLPEPGAVTSPAAAEAAPPAARD